MRGGPRLLQPRSCVLAAEAALRGLEVPLSPDLPLTWPGQAVQALFPFTHVPGGEVNDVQLICVQRGIRKSIV